MTKQLFVLFVLTFCLVMGVAVTANAQAQQTQAQQDQDQYQRLMITVSGFQNNQDALLAITQFKRVLDPDTPLVRSEPDQIMEVRATAFSFKSWTELDRNQIRKNSEVRVASRVLDNVLGNAQRRTSGGILGNILNQGRGEANREAYRRQDSEQVRMEEWRGQVNVRLIDAHTHKIIMESIGQCVITVENRRRNYEQPELILRKGDLSAVGMQQGENLNGNLRQVLAMAAFYDASNKQNTIGGQ